VTFFATTPSVSKTPSQWGSNPDYRQAKIEVVLLGVFPTAFLELFKCEVGFFSYPILENLFMAFEFGFTIPTPYA
jgi:hypothetical protein